MSKLVVTSNFISEVMKQLAGKKCDKTTLINAVNETELFKSSNQPRLNKELEVVLVIIKLSAKPIMYLEDVEDILTTVVNSVSFGNIVSDSKYNVSKDPKFIKTVEYQERYENEIIKPVLNKLGLESYEFYRLTNRILTDVMIQVELGYSYYSSDIEFWSSVLVSMERTRSYKKFNEYLQTNYNARLLTYDELTYKE